MLAEGIHYGIVMDMIATTQGTFCTIRAGPRDHCPKLSPPPFKPFSRKKSPISEIAFWSAPRCTTCCMHIIHRQIRHPGSMGPMLPLMTRYMRRTQMLFAPKQRHGAAGLYPDHIVMMFMPDCVLCKNEGSIGKRGLDLNCSRSSA